MHVTVNSVLIDLVTNGAHGCLFWHVAYRAWRFNRSPVFQNTSNLCSHLLIKRPAAEYATQNPYGNLTGLSLLRVRVWPARLVFFHVAGLQWEQIFRVGPNISGKFVPGGTNFKGGPN